VEERQCYEGVPNQLSSAQASLAGESQSTRSRKCKQDPLFLPHTTSISATILACAETPAAQSAHVAANSALFVQPLHRPLSLAR
jgi:hypothetical protein